MTLAITLITIILLVAIISILIYVIRKDSQKGQNDVQFDDRQKYERFRAGYISFFFLIIYNFVLAVYTGIFDDLIMPISCLICIGLVVSFVVYMCVCIWKDTVSAKAQPKTPLLILYIIWTIIFLINAIYKFMNLNENPETFYLAFFYSLFALAFLVILINMIIKKIYDKKHRKEIEK